MWMKLLTGDLVVYGSHGVGRVAPGPEEGESARTQVVVAFASGLSVTLPLARALESLRPLAGTSELASVQATLRSQGSPSEESWLKRCKEAQAKVVAGELIGLAEVVRDGDRRESMLTASGKRLSANEQQIYQRAQRLLADEIGLAQGLEPDQANDWIRLQLAHESS